MSEDKYKQIFSQNLRYYMSLNNKEQIDLINDLGFNKSAVSTWCNGTRLPRMDKVNMLAEYFHINRSDLIEVRQPTVISKSTITCNTDDESNLILSFRKLNTENKKRCSAYATSLLITQEMEDAVALNAAHDSGATPEQKQHADNIMEDPDEWT